MKELNFIPGINAAVISEARQQGICIKCCRKAKGINKSEVELKNNKQVMVDLFHLSRSKENREVTVKRLLKSPDADLPSNMLSQNVQLWKKTKLKTVSEMQPIVQVIFFNALNIYLSIFTSCLTPSQA